MDYFRSKHYYNHNPLTLEHFLFQCFFLFRVESLLNWKSYRWTNLQTCKWSVGSRQNRRQRPKWREVGSMAGPIVGLSHSLLPRLGVGLLGQKAWRQPGHVRIGPTTDFLMLFRTHQVGHPKKSLKRCLAQALLDREASSSFHQSYTIWKNRRSDLELLVSSKHMETVIHQTIYPLRRETYYFPRHRTAIPFC